MCSAKKLEGLLGRLRTLADGSMQGAGSLEPAGYPPLYVKIIDYVMRSQTSSFYLALVVIFALMLLWLRSVRLALISLVPNVFPVVVMLGVMGALGIHLDVATATVAAIVMGVAVDDTVHILHHWRALEKQGVPWEGCLADSFRKTGTAAVTTTVLLLVGYPVLMLAGVKTVVYFGLLTTVASAAAFYGDMVILPLMMRLWPARAAQGATKTSPPPAA
jgi:hypothetical protein